MTVGPVKKLTLLITLAPTLCFGMDRMSALSMLETGNDDRMVGRAGEISRYQVLKREWHSVSASTRYRDPEIAKQVALQLLDQRVERFTRVYHRSPTDFEFYVLWNAPAQVLAGRISHTVAERATRFVNLCSIPDNPGISLAKAPGPQRAGVLERPVLKL